MATIIESKWSVGEKLPNGCEVVEVRYEPKYVLRKKVTLDKDIPLRKMGGKTGWLYFDGAFSYFMLENGKRRYKIREIEYTY